MPQVYAANNVQAAPEVIFDFLADYENIPRVQPQFTSARLISEESSGVGACVELRGKFHGVPLTARNRIITFSRPHRLVSISEGTVLSRNTWELRPLHTPHPDAPTTEVSLMIEYKVMGGPFASLFAGLASGLFHAEVQALTEESLRRLHAIFAAK